MLASMLTKLVLKYALPASVWGCDILSVRVFPAFLTLVLCICILSWEGEGEIFYDSARKENFVALFLVFFITFFVMLLYS